MTKKVKTCEIKQKVRNQPIEQENKKYMNYF